MYTNLGKPKDPLIVMKKDSERKYIDMYKEQLILIQKTVDKDTYDRFVAFLEIILRQGFWQAAVLTTKELFIDNIFSTFITAKNIVES